mgnify:CR=1 FL=1
MGSYSRFQPHSFPFHFQRSSGHVAISDSKFSYILALSEVLFIDEVVQSGLKYLKHHMRHIQDGMKCGL